MLSAPKDISDVQHDAGAGKAWASLGYRTEGVQRDSRSVSDFEGITRVRRETDGRRVHTPLKFT